MTRLRLFGLASIAVFLIKRLQLAQRFGLEVQIAFDGIAEAFEFAEAEVAKFDFKAKNQAEEYVFAVEFCCVPSPVTSWREVFD